MLGLRHPMRLCVQTLGFSMLLWLLSAAFVVMPTPSAQPSASPPSIEAHVTLDTGWAFPLVNVRDPVTYRLRIKRDAQVQILPESIASSALRRALARATALPAELFDIVDTEKHIDHLADARLQETVAYTLRFSKPGTYTIPTLPIAYHLPQPQGAPRRLQSLPQQGYLLTVKAHLAAGMHALPGNILEPPRWLWRSPSWLHPLAIGLLASGALALVVGLLFTIPRQRQVRKQKRLSPQQLHRKYQVELQQLRDHVPTPTDVFSLEERTWLRQCAALLRRLLGEWSYGDPMRFAGGAGVSAAMIKAHMQLPMTVQDVLLEPSLPLLQELDVITAATSYTLTSEDYKRFVETVEQTILRLTSRDATLPSKD